MIRNDRAGRRARMAPPVAAAFGVGMLVGWLLHAWGPPAPAIDPSRYEAAPHPIAPTLTAGGDVTSQSSRTPLSPSHQADDAIAALRRRQLRSPIDGVDFDRLKGAFSERRTGGGGHVHEAVDILADRHTPIRAVENGSVARLLENKAGGRTIYQHDPSSRFVYYYAHLQRYADGLREGQAVKAGEIIGYVGTSGNAPPNTPHLHFAIFALDANARWWEGQPIDPYLVWRR